MDSSNEPSKKIIKANPGVDIWSDLIINNHI